MPPIRHADEFEQLVDAGAIGTHAFAVNQERQRDVLFRREGRHEVVELKNETDLAPSDKRQLVILQQGKTLIAEFHFALGRLIEPAEQVEERGLARAARPHDRDEFAGIDGQVHPVERVHRHLAEPILLAQRLGFQNRHIPSL